MLFDLESVKHRQPLEEVAARYVPLRRSGSRLVGLCPFHDERTPSFTVEPSKGIYRCYGCGRWGDVFDFLQQVEGLTFREALARLGGEMAVHTNDSPIPPRRVPAPEEVKNALSVQEAAVLHVAVQWWHDALLRHSTALAYLDARGVDHATIVREQIGYADGHVLLPLRWYGGSYLEAAYNLGLIDRGGHDRFAGRIILPELRRERPIWLTGRLLDIQPGQWGSDLKYLTLRGVERPLLGYDTAAAVQVPKGGGVLVCEGPFDRLAAARWGYTAVALGSAWANARAKREVRILLVDKKRGYLVPDRDAAGHRGMLALIEQLDLPPDLRPSVVRLPLATKDLGELTTHPDGEEILAQRLAAAALARQRHMSRATADHTTGQADRSLTPLGLS